MCVVVDVMLLILMVCTHVCATHPQLHQSLTFSNRQRLIGPFFGMRNQRSVTKLIWSGQQLSSDREGMRVQLLRP